MKTEQRGVIMNKDKISTLLILKQDIVTSDFVNKTRQDEYGCGFKDAIKFVREIIDNKLQEYVNEDASLKDVKEIKLGD